MNKNEDTALRTQLAKVLDGGLPTEWQQRAYDSEDRMLEVHFAGQTES